MPPGWTTWLALPNIHAVGYVTDYLAKKSNEFIDEANRANKPFFLVLSTLSPHAGTKPAPRHASLFPSATAPRTASFNEADVSDKPPFLQVPLMTAVRLPPTTTSIETGCAACRPIDEAILAIYRKVERIGQLPQTYFVFTSDNGYHLGQHRLTGGKETTYDEDLRMPLLMRGPGIPAGLTVTELVSNADLAPTIATWAEGDTGDSGRRPVARARAQGDPAGGMAQVPGHRALEQWRVLEDADTAGLPGGADACVTPTPATLPFPGVLSVYDLQSDELGNSRPRPEHGPWNADACGGAPRQPLTTRCCRLAPAARAVIRAALGGRARRQPASWRRRSAQVEDLRPPQADLA